MFTGHMPREVRENVDIMREEGEDIKRVKCTLEREKNSIENEKCRKD